MKKSNLRAGDIYYTKSSKDGADTYHVFKVLLYDEDFEILHTLGYWPVSKEPTKDDLNELEVFIYHFPLAVGNDDDIHILDNRPVQEDELIGYYEYLRQISSD